MRQRALGVAHAVPQQPLRIVFYARGPRGIVGQVHELVRIGGRVEEQRRQAGEVHIFRFSVLQHRQALDQVEFGANQPARVRCAFLDGLEDAYEPGRAMGSFAEETCTEYQFTREAQDEYALRSLSRANEAIASGAFDREIVPVEVVGRKGTETITVDEQPGKANPDKIPTLKPAFAKDGTITAANASSISDGAAALVVTRQSVAEAQGLNIAARIVSWATHSQEPAKFTSAPVPAIRSAMEKAGWTVADVDLFEVNEAFAMVPMIAMKELGIPAEKLNVNGGGTALGHPIGASGARIIATLIAALQNRGLKRGVASLCIGGGEGTAIAVEIA